MNEYCTRIISLTLLINADRSLKLIHVGKYPLLMAGLPFRALYRPSFATRRAQAHNEKKTFHHELALNVKVRTHLGSAVSLFSMTWKNRQTPKATALRGFVVYIVSSPSFFSISWAFPLLFRW